MKEIWCIDLGFTSAYKTNESIRYFCGMLDALVFIPVDDIQKGLEYIQSQVPDGENKIALESLVSYFDATYISGTVRRIQRPGESGDVRLHLRCLLPLFHPPLWNVHEATLAGDDRTNNLCESWNNAFKHLVGHSHPSIWNVIQALQQEQSMMALTLL